MEVEGLTLNNDVPTLVVLREMGDVFVNVIPVRAGHPLSNQIPDELGVLLLQSLVIQAARPSSTQWQ